MIFATALHTLSPLEDWFWIPDNQIWYIYSMNSYQSSITFTLLSPCPGRWPWMVTVITGQCCGIIRRSGQGMPRMGESESDSLDSQVRLSSGSYQALAPSPSCPWAGIWMIRSLFSHEVLMNPERNSSASFPSWPDVCPLPSLCLSPDSGEKVKWIIFLATCRADSWPGY